MPFTPLHLGPGLAIKGLIPKHFSFSMFALANVAMDVEPLYRMWRIEFPVHGFSHTLTGALLIAAGTAIAGRAVITAAWRLYGRLGDGENFSMTWLQAWSGALLGTGSHLLLDAVMHADLRPFSPLTDANPLLTPEWFMPLHLGCVLAGMLGMALILTRTVWRGETA
jgi:membrane-bound metal-dependent hydrolase YbcI (DUF457 family)